MELLYIAIEQVTHAAIVGCMDILYVRKVKYTVKDIQYCVNKKTIEQTRQGVDKITN